MSGKTGRFGRSDRLLDSRDFRRVLRQGRRRAHRDLVVVTAPKREFRSDSRSLSSTEHTSVGAGSRLGITASRKVGNAVIRNRFKRRLRAWFRVRRDALPAEIDLVVIARRSGAQLSLAELDDRLTVLLGLDARAAGPQ